MLVFRAERFAVGETRKIAAILVADVVGYSQLAGADETGRSHGSGLCAATSSIPPSPCIAAALSS